MTSTSESSSLASGLRTSRSFRWDVLAVVTALISATTVVIVAIRDRLSPTTAFRSSSVGLVVGIIALAATALAIAAIRSWVTTPQRAGTQAGIDEVPISTAADEKRSAQRDVIGIAFVICAAIVTTAIFGNGGMADWLTRQPRVLLDIVLAAAGGLVPGLVYFSMRRWSALSRHVDAVAELSLTTSRINRETRLLGELSDLLQSCQSLEEAYALMAERTQLLFPGFSGAICMMAPSRDVVDVAVSWGTPLLTDGFFQPADCWALRRGKTHLLDADPTHVRCGHIAAARSHRAACVPMMAHGEALGVLYLDRIAVPGTPEEMQAQRTWSPHEARLVHLLGEQAALAFANLVLRDTLRMQSIRDPLTGLYNRRYLEESLERELRRSSRSGATVGVMMIDVDHFKRLNDTYGHDVGDEVLRTVGAVLRQDLRKEDVVSRYGGEEFTVMLPGASLEVTRQRAEVVRESIGKTVVQSRGQTLDPITVSLGIAVSPHHGTAADALLRSADTALYRAKQTGRNRVTPA